LLNEEATQVAILNSLDQFLSTASSDDQVIVFFAGHGMLDSLMNFYYAAYDVDFKNPETKGISYELILEKLGKLPLSRKLLLIDACHSGNVFSPVHSPDKKDSLANSASKGGKVQSVKNTKLNDNISEIYDVLFGSVSDQYGVTVLAASSGANLAYESKDLSNGAFTGAYIESILSEFRTFYSGALDFTLQKPIALTDEKLYAIRKKVIVA